ncbi:MAG: hypothetical protein JWN43_3675 [Gammaproteobacteria bacterium]|nr:hypothetical protein [Gammaproteobacteria bacterium]
MAAATHNRARRLSVFALVVALHIAVYWGFLQATRPLEVRTASPTLELTYLTLVAPESATTRPAPVRPSQPLMRQSVAPPPVSRPRLDSPPNAPASGEEDNAIHPPIDWANELNRTARESASGESAPKPREFGAPHVAPTRPPKPPEFGWSRSRTHRLERGPGSTGIHVGDHCVMSFTPLPSVVCGPGKKEANGDLFKHMHDPPQLGDWKDPP